MAPNAACVGAGQANHGALTPIGAHGLKAAPTTKEKSAPAHISSTGIKQQTMATKTTTEGIGAVREKFFERGKIAALSFVFSTNSVLLFQRQLPPPRRMSHPHTFSGVCVYCGSASTDADHLDTCPPYLLVVEQEKDEHSVLVSNDDNGDDNKENEPPACHPRKRKATAAAAARDNTRRVSISPTDRVRQADPKNSTPTSRSIWDCLACGEANCAFENGAMVLDAGRLEEEEDDPHQPKHSVEECEEWTRDKAFNFEACRGAIMNVTVGILLSKGFFSHNKFVGSKALDLKLKTWIRYRVPASVVDRHWYALRETAKLSLGYKRQACVESIRVAFIGK